MYFDCSDWGWRIDYFDTVSYNEMVLKFWKPLDSFYEDKFFIIKGEKIMKPVTSVYCSKCGEFIGNLGNIKECPICGNQLVEEDE